MTYQHQEFPAWRYGPNGASVIVNSEDETPKGFSAERSKGPATEGTKTAVAPSNGTASAVEASKTTTAKSQTQTPPEVSAKAGVGGGSDSPQSGARASTTDESKGADPSKATLDAHGHVYDPSLHAGTGSKTKAGLWRMKVGVKRPDPAPGYPLDL